MKSFIKQNTLFIVINTISITLFFVLIYFSVDFSQRSEELLKKTENTKQDLSEINDDKKDLRHIISDYKEIQSDLKIFSSIEKDLSNFFKLLS